MVAGLSPAKPFAMGNCNRNLLSSLFLCFLRHWSCILIHLVHCAGVSDALQEKGHNLVQGSVNQHLLPSLPPPKPKQNNQANIFLPQTQRVFQFYIFFVLYASPHPLFFPQGQGEICRDLDLSVRMRAWTQLSFTGRDRRFLWWQHCWIIQSASIIHQMHRRAGLIVCDVRSFSFWVSSLFQGSEGEGFQHWKQL